MKVSEYKQAREAIDANHKAVMRYLTKHKTNAMPVEVSKKMPFADMVNNELRSRVETYEFIHDIPESYFLYINEEKKIATTWTGDSLGAVFFGREYTSNFGDTRQPIDVMAINGKRYHGIYYKSSGDYARIKLYKTKGV